MKTYFKVLIVSFLAIASTLSLTGCGTILSSSTPTIVVWGFQDEDVFKPIIKDFQSQNKNVNVTYIKKTLDANYENDALNSILSGAGPDVWAIPNDWVYRHKDKLAPMPDTLLSSKKIVAKDYFADIILKDNVIENKIYGLSPTVDVLQAYYNPTLFDSAKSAFDKANQNNDALRTQIDKIFNNFPITWEEFNKIIPYLTAKNGATITTAGAAIGSAGNVSDSADLLSLLMLQNQTKITADDLSQATFNLPVKNSANQDVFAGKNALDFYTSFSNPGSADYTWNSAQSNDIDAFVNGKVAMIFGCSNLAGYFRQVYPNFSFAQARVPQVGDTNSIVDFAKYTTYVVPAASPQQANGWNFITMLSTDDASTYRSATKEISSRLQQTDVNLKDRGAGTPDAEQLKTASDWNKGRYPVELDNLFKDAINRVEAKSTGSQASLDTAAAKATEYLRRSGW
ncbi:MAG: extracellular solute-binding protein [Candidatus Berkelbacteria bacterium]|nr:extracellular solute-binding protein [Candidatus Berkelbacteria bacterium]